MASFLLCWFPYACASISEIAGYKPESDLAFYLMAVPTLLAKASVCIDPCIYFGMNPQVFILVYINYICVHNCAYGQS